MKILFYLCVLTSLIVGLSAFRLAIRVCFKELATITTQDSCAYCNPKTLLRTMKNCTNTDDGLPIESGNDIGPGTIWLDIHKECVLNKCKEEYPDQRVLPTLFPIDSPKTHLHIATKK